MFHGRNLAEEAITFETGQRYDNVRIVMTDRWTRLQLIVRGPDGEPTWDYVAIAFPVEREEWKRGAWTVRSFAPMAPAPTKTIGTTISAEVLPPEAFHGVPAGDYFVIAVDDISREETWDPAILDRFVQSAERVTLSDGVPVQLSLRRFTRADLVR
jgi:hypothetical protein